MQGSTNEGHLAMKYFLGILVEWLGNLGTYFLNKVPEVLVDFTWT